MNKTSNISAAAFLIASTFLAACATTQQQYEDPVMVMQKSEDPHARMAAARQAEERFADDPRRITALQNTLWEWGRFHEERQYAIDQLMKLDPEHFPALLARRILVVKNPETIAYICQLAVKEKWGWFTPALVRSWARPLPSNIDEARPEIAAIEALNPGKQLVNVVFEVFANEEDQSSSHEQIAAWRLLWDIASYERISELLVTAQPRTPLVADLQAAAADLHSLPIRREGVLRMWHLRDSANEAWWAQARQRVAMLSASQKRGLSLRHMPILLTASDQQLSRSREQLSQSIASYLDGQTNHLRGPNFDGPMSDYPQRFNQAGDKLAWADLLTIDVLLKAAAAPEVRAAFFKQADADLQDNRTEYGGVLGTTADRGYQAVAYPPMYRKHDMTFIPSDKMITALYTQLAHYHFHAQHQRNRDYAGPSMGDMRMAAALETHCLVLTFIDRDTLNMDYYQPDGVVVDLGEIRRP